MPGFCWDLNASGSCEVEKDKGEIVRPDHYVGEIDKDNALEVDSEAFKFRVACHKSSSKCDSGKPDWEIEFVDFYHTLDGKETDKDEDDYKLNANFNFKKDNETRNNWEEEDNKIDGGQDQLWNGMSGNVKLTLIINKGQVKKLKPGTHRYTFVIRGEGNYNDKVNRRIHYPFVFDVSDDKQVRISRLQPVNLRSFPDHMSYYTQNICIHASGDGKFGLRAEGGDKRTNNFQLSSTANNVKSTISYLAMYGVGNDIEESLLKKMNSDTENKIFVGHKHEFCNGGTNMTLAIKLNTTFEQLSQKPAGNYTDTLTLIVEAK